MSEPPHVEHVVTAPVAAAEHDAADAVHELQETLAEDRGREEGERWARMEAELAEARRLHEETRALMSEHLASHTSSSPQETAEQIADALEEQTEELQQQEEETAAEVGTLPVVEQQEQESEEVTPVHHDDEESSDSETRRLKRVFHSRQ